ncbi:hypothetical protein BJX63DRAFT_386218 [Aspergillus granulosus]|uniref:Uncharacterized protein n=1 Tax=Aspergillus granulosus TaxID=176169 RepID=A0ABR4HP23_9EURO
MLVDLTVGQVSGLIAAGVVVVKLVLPTLFAFLFVGTLREENNAATTSAVAWSSISRFLHSSHWPTILSSDSAALSGVPGIVLFFRFSGLFFTFLISIAAVITPLGLFEAIVPGHPAPEQFHHIVDDGIFGIGTQERNQSVPWSRVCGTLDVPTTCSDLTRGPATADIPIDRSIPQGTIDIFTSGISATSNTVSSIFDIQCRSWTWTKFSDDSQGNGSAQYPIGIYQQIATLALEDRFVLVEGLVVDTKNGGIGLRNHSAPAMTTHGRTWSEGLLFIQPVSSCVDTNLTLDYSMAESEVINITSGEMSPIRLVDRGGFSSLNRTYPAWNRTNVQANPQLWERAYQSAWLNNVFVSGRVGVGNVTIGQGLERPLILHELGSTTGREFPLPSIYSASCLIDTQRPGVISANSYGCYSVTMPREDSWENIPLAIENLCAARNFDSGLGNIGNIATLCKLIIGASHRTDGPENDSTSIHLPGTTWSKPMYSCAMAVEAIIKTVTFAFNATDDLTGLTVLNITDKEYESESEYPLWGVENILDTLPAGYVELPLWGLISHEVASMFPQGELQTVRKKSLFLPLPGYFQSRQMDLQNLPGVGFYRAGLGVVSEIGLGFLGQQDYTGKADLAMSRQWIALSKSAESMSKALNLVWTDFAANAVVGTKGSPGSSNTVTRPVTTYRSAIQYDLLYAIPAIMILAILLLISVLSLLATLLGRASLAKVKRYLNVTSSGRIMTSMIQPLARNVDNDTPSGEWIKTEGKMSLTAGKTMPSLSVVGHQENSALLGKGAIISREA